MGSLASLSSQQPTDFGLGAGRITSISVLVHAGRALGSAVGLHSIPSEWLLLRLFNPYQHRTCSESDLRVGIRRARPEHACLQQLHLMQGSFPPGEGWAYSLASAVGFQRPTGSPVWPVTGSGRTCNMAAAVFDLMLSRANVRDVAISKGLTRSEVQWEERGSK